MKLENYWEKFLGKSMDLILFRKVFGTITNTVFSSLAFSLFK